MARQEKVIKQIAPADGWFAVIVLEGPGGKPEYTLERVEVWALFKAGDVEGVWALFKAGDVEWVDGIAPGPLGVDPLGEALGFPGFIHEDDLDAEMQAWPRWRLDHCEG